jgi:DNA-directed RNA polymerase specialized sigma24 family protein
MSTDAELLQLYAERGSQPAFSTLVERHLALVYSAALRQVGNNPHRAQEVVQTVFTLLARKVRPLSRHPALIGWLYTTTYYTADKLRRAEQRRERLASVKRRQSKGVRLRILI